MSMLYLESPVTDPSFNLALEQYVFDSLDRSHEYFMLWQNDHAIIIGKNQNTLEEIDAAYVKKHGVQVVRRMSGGGAVYHDLGNLNYTFVVDAGQSSSMDLKKFGRIMADALNRIGIPAKISGRNDILIDGKKFSGNAQYIRDGRIMHHGTLMFDSNLSVLSNALKVSDSKILSKGVKSVRSRVTNISSHLPYPMTLQEFKKHLLDCLFREEALSSYTLTPRDLAAVLALQESIYDTWEWNYGYSPQYEISKRRRFEGCGELKLSMDVKEGSIRALSMHGDYFGLKDTAELSHLLVGVKLREADLHLALKQKHIEVCQYFSGLTAEDFVAFLTT